MCSLMGQVMALAITCPMLFSIFSAPHPPAPINMHREF